MSQTTPDPACPAVVHGRAPYGRCICAPADLAAATGMMPRAGDDRRADPRRGEDQRVHLARELVIDRARAVRNSLRSPLGLDVHAVEQLAELVEVLDQAEADVLEIRRARAESTAPR